MSIAVIGKTNHEEDMKMSNIAMTPCESSQVEAHGYDSISKTLAVKFVRGSVYHYADVPQEVYEALKSAESVGKFFGKEIKGKYEFTKQPEKKEI